MEYVVGMIKTLRSVVRFRHVEWDPALRRLRRSASIDDLRLIERYEDRHTASLTTSTVRLKMR